MRAYEYRHIVSFKETNVVGNVYFSNYVSWQGRCREMFMREHAPGVLDEITNGLALVTTRVSCEYFEELRAFDEIIIKMYAQEVGPGRVTMAFDYFRLTDEGEQLVARGEQQVASMRRGNGTVTPIPLPPALIEALSLYTA